jgi:hypothetical protein
MDAGAPVGDVGPDPFVVFDYDTLLDGIGVCTIDRREVDHWVFPTGATLIDDGSQILLGGLAQIAVPVPGRWRNEDGGSFNNPDNWSDNTVPDGEGAPVNFLSAILENTTVAVDEWPVTVGTINFRNTSSYRIEGPETITMAISGEDPTITVERGDHTIAAPLLFTALTADVQAGSLTLEQSGDVTGAVKKTGDGTLLLPAGMRLAGALTASGGVVDTGKYVLSGDGGPITIADGTVIVSGSVPRPIVLGGGAFTSFIRASGPTTLGDQGANNYEFGGILQTNSQSVAVLGPPGTPVVHFVEMTGGGTLTGVPELQVAPVTGYIYGTGNVTGTVRMGDPSDTAYLKGLSGASKLEISGLITGDWTDLGNVLFTGAPKPGFSAEFTMTGPGSSYADTPFEIGGTTPTVRTDSPPEDSFEEGNYSQYYNFGTEAGAGEPTMFCNPTLSLDHQTTFHWNQLVPGDQLNLIVTGPWNMVDPAPPFLGGGPKAYKAGLIAYGPTFEQFEIDLLAQMDLIAPQLAEGLQWGPYTMNDQLLMLTVVPEPGTLVLLLSGGLGLLFWRRRRAA